MSESSSKHTVPSGLPGILFLEALPTISGGQTVLTNLIPGLNRQYRLAALLPGIGPLADTLSRLNVDCFFAPIGQFSLVHKHVGDMVSYGFRLPWLVFLAWRLIRHWRADVIYANSGPTFVWGALAAQLAGRPIIWHHHNLLADGTTLALVRTAARLPAVRRILCVSPAAQAQFPAVQDKTLVIRNGVDTTRFQSDPSAGQRIRLELGVPRDARVIGLVGDLIPLKGQSTLLDALPRVNDVLPNVWSVLVGNARTGDAESERYFTHLHASARPQVLLLGRRTDLPDLLNAFDLLVVASERETGPLVMLEAMACGLPVISTPVGMAPDVLPKDALFAIGDTSALAQRLIFWFSSPAQLAAQSLAGRQFVEQNLSLDHFQARIRSEIERCI